MSAFKKATKQQSRLRMAIHGASGSGKTYTALAVATALGSRVALIDTERGSASKYAGLFEFDVCEVYDDYHPKRLEEALKDAASAGYDAIVVDSTTHFYKGPGGVLDLHDQECKRMAARGGRVDSFAAWRAITPIYDRMIQSLLAVPAHLFVTARAKSEYVKEDKTVKKVGLAPEMRDGWEFEFDVEGMLDAEHHLVIGKTRCQDLDGRVFHKPGKDVAAILQRWLTDGVAPKSWEDQIAEARDQVALEAVRAAMKSANAVTDDRVKLWKSRSESLSAV